MRQGAESSCWDPEIRLNISLPAPGPAATYDEYETCGERWDAEHGAKKAEEQHALDARSRYGLRER